VLAPFDGVALGFQACDRAFLNKSQAAWCYGRLSDTEVKLRRRCPRLAPDHGTSDGADGGALPRII